MSQKNQSTQVQAKQQAVKPVEPKTTSDQQQAPLEMLIGQATVDPKSLTPADTSQLQRSIGNRAISRLITRTNPRQTVNPASITVSLQRMLISRGVQAKLTVNAPVDEYEQEEDTVAKQVVTTLNTPGVQKANTQRQEEDEQIMAKPMVQRFDHGSGGSVNDTVEQDIQQARGGGQPLADNIRGPMETAFGADFSEVKIHTHAKSNELNQAVQAKAFTIGQDIFFRQGEYNTGNQAGQELLAHELTHVVQQNGQNIQRRKTSDNSSASIAALLTGVGAGKSNPVVQRGFLEKHLGNANPRNYLPEAIGGYTPQQIQRNTTRAALRALGLQDDAVETLVSIHLTRNPPAGYNHADMLTVGQELVNLGGDNALAQRIVFVINAVGAPVLPPADLMILMELHATHNNGDISNLATALRVNPGWGAGRLRDLAQLPQNLANPLILTLAPLNRAVADIGQLLAGNIVGVPAPTIPEIVQLEGTSNIDIAQIAGLGQVNTVVHIIQLKGALARAGARPLADVVTLGTNLAHLTVDELDALVVAPAVNALGEYLVQDGIQQNRTADNIIDEAHTNSTLILRQAVANSIPLRSVIRERWVAGGVATAIMSTLLEGSLHWLRGSGPDAADNYRIEGGTTFADWIRGGNENNNPPSADAVSTMNCWEGVLFAAYLAGKLSYAQLTAIHIQAATAANLIDPGSAGYAAYQVWDAGGRVGPIPAQVYNFSAAEKAYYDELAPFLNAHISVPWDPAAMPLTGIPIGQIMFFTDAAVPTDMDKLEHVAISLGRGVGFQTEIMSHWNHPGNAFQYLRINQLIGPGYDPDIYTAPSPW